jgi:hypothetical protein
MGLWTLGCASGILESALPAEHESAIERAFVDVLGLEILGDVNEGLAAAGTDRLRMPGRRFGVRHHRVLVSVHFKSA